MRIILQPIRIQYSFSILRILVEQYSITSNINCSVTLIVPPNGFGAGRDST